MAPRTHDELGLTADRLQQLAFGAPPRGWVIVGRTRRSPRPVVGLLVDQFREACYTPLVVPLEMADLQLMAARIGALAELVRSEVAGGSPVAFLGAGRAAAAGWLASLNGEVDAVLGWNARARAVWPALPDVEVPSLLAVSRPGTAGRRAARAAAARLGGPADVVAPRSRDDLALLPAWCDYRLLGGSRAVVAPYDVATPRVRRVASTAAVAAGVALVPLAATPSSAALPDFSSGKRLSAPIAGDVPAEPGDPEPPTGGRTVKEDEVKGDGPIGDPPLTDNSGFRWNINTNVGFTTSSSASGAVSEGAFTVPVNASTLNGGTVNQVLVDAFDGYNALCLDVNNVGGQCNTANMSVYNQLGPSSLECSGRQVVLPNQVVGNLAVRRKVFVPTNDEFARWLNIVTNNSAVPQTVRLQTSNNLGSDAGTIVVTSEDGDANAEVTDGWVTTFQNFSGTTSSDPRLGHVLQGNAPIFNSSIPVGLNTNSFVNGDDNPFWRYVFTLPAGRTAIIMNFATGQPTKAHAAAEAAALSSLSNPNALSCMTPTEIGQVRNFDLNEAPLGVADAYATDQDVQLVVNAANGVLDNDTDNENDPLTATMVSGPAHGNVMLSPDGSLVYNPDPGYNGLDSFTYRASDGVNDSAVTTVTLTVNALGPTALDDSYTTDEDTALVVNAANGVLDNDTDPEGDPLVAALVAGPTHGGLVLNADGSFTYTPDANYHGPDSFTYKAVDGSSESNVATVSLTVDPVPDVPVANDDSYGTDEDTPLVVSSADGVLDNDSDADGDPLQVSVATGPAHGSLALSPNGSFTYTPDPNYHGPDSFTYTAFDGMFGSMPATVSITVNPVNDPPVAGDASYTLDEDTQLSEPAPGVLGGVSDVDGDSVSAVLVTGPAHGGLVLNSDGSFTYTPNADYFGPDSFTYRANDGTTSSNVATVSLTVEPVPEAPTAVDDAYELDEDTAFTTPEANGVLGNDSDADGDPLTAELASEPEHGAVDLQANGTFTYTPDADYAGPDSFTYTATDGTLDSDPATVSLTVAPVDDAPTIVTPSGGSCVTADSAAVLVSVADIDTALENLSVQTSTSVPGVLAGIDVVDLGGGLYEITLTAGNIGVTEVTVSVDDGTTTASIPVRVSVGSADHEIFTASPGRDVQLGLGGNDVLKGGKGADVLCGGPGNDDLLSGTGVDGLFGQGGADVLKAGDIPSALYGGGGPDLLLGGEGADLMSGGGGGDELDGAGGDDEMRGNAGSDLLLGRQGDDTMTGGTGADTFNGGTGQDTVTDMTPEDSVIGFLPRR